MFDHFDLLAPLYDRAIPFSRLDLMLRVVNLPVDGLLLDAGGGTGRVAIALKPYTRDVVVADVSAGMLSQTRQKRLTGIMTPSEKLPFSDGTFPRIIMVDALHHVINQRETIAELWRVLQPGGRLVIEEPDIRTLPVKFVAVVEKLALMRSHFLSPPEIVSYFPPEARVTVELESYNAWVVVEK
jgi:demethylmenaquinone methyltransferase/2-methoxy-6-polyprenyl-1,4-benzoquinol methylase